MSHEFAAWVSPIADRYRSKREEVAKLAGQIPEQSWASASPTEGWSYHDVLAHLAEGDVSVQNTIQTVIEGGDTDFRTWNNGREERIAAGLQRGATQTRGQLIARVLSEGEQTQQLLALLTDEHEHVQVITSRTNPEPQPLATFLADYHHDEEHLEHLRPAVGEVSVS